MPEEIKTAKVDGTIVSIPTGERAYLVTELPLKGTEIIPFEKAPIETRIVETIEKLREALTKKKKEEIK